MWGILYLVIAILFFVGACSACRNLKAAQAEPVMAIFFSILAGLFWPATILALIGMMIMGVKIPE